jgi:Tail tubular protein
MPTQLAPTTELEAVNQMLGTILEAPINSLLGVESLDAQVAIDILAEKSRALQMTGWNFNTEEAYPLAPDAFTGEVSLPLNTLSADPSDPLDDLVQRGARLYDRANHTYAIARSVKVDITFLLPFNEMPEAARRYVSVMACRTFQKRQVGSTTLDAFTEDDEKQARLAFKRVMGSSSEPNIFNSQDMRQKMRRQ